MNTLAPKTPTALPKEALHLWSADLDLGKNFRGILSSDEIARAEKYHTTRDRDRFVAGRGTLRSVLSHYLRLAPEEMEFRCNEFGKPFLAHEPLQFNVSHSDGKFLVAISHHAVGIDLERMRSDLEILQIAETHFEPGEFATLCALPEQDRVQEFFALWTAKEALCKAMGRGITGGLTSTLPSGWSVKSLPAPAGYSAALAIQSTRFDETLFHL